jgi:hypothetical protein
MGLCLREAITRGEEKQGRTRLAHLQGHSGQGTSICLSPDPLQGPLAPVCSPSYLGG